MSKSWRRDSDDRNRNTKQKANGRDQMREYAWKRRREQLEPSRLPTH